MKVKQVMTAEVATVGPTTPLKDVARLLGRRRISGVPVVDVDGTVLGVVSEGDVLVKEQGSIERTRRFWRLDDPDASRRAKRAAVTAAEAMTSPAVVVGPERAVATAARIMIDSGVNRLPVVEDGRLVGIVTRADLVRAFARPDSELEREIRTEVLEQAMWIASDSVHVSVAEGVVRLSGIVETQTDAEVMTRLVERVPGVVSVASEVGWRMRAPEELVR
jgi:CBS domain-containing protein